MVLSFIRYSIYVIIFYAAWIICMTWLPILLVSSLCLLSNPAAALNKLQLLTTAIPFLLFSKDKKWKTPLYDPADAIASSHQNEDNDDTTSRVVVETKTIYFVRHGESTWNDTFNKGDRPRHIFLLQFLPNLIRAVVYEWYLLVSGQESESWFYDSPLSSKGIGQAKALREFMDGVVTGGMSTDAERDAVKVLLGGGGGGTNGATTTNKSRLVSSNLRRAILTMAVGFQDRLDKQIPDDEICIMTDLQEISTNPDALCITPPGADVVSSFADREIANDKTSSSSPPPINLERIYNQQISTKHYHRGNKEFEGNGLQRLQNFSSAIFSSQHGFEDVDTVICAGHSLWFRSFFRTYLPYGEDHVAKRKKIVNGGVVGFTLSKVVVKESGGDGGVDRFFIDPASIKVVYLGF